MPRANQIDPTTGRRFGDHGTAQNAIDFVLSNGGEAGVGETEAFLRCWTEGDLGGWPDFYAWLAKSEGR